MVAYGIILDQRWPTYTFLVMTKPLPCNLITPYLVYKWRRATNIPCIYMYGDFHGFGNHRFNYTLCYIQMEVQTSKSIN
jgi:hypothetical protein